MGNKTSVSKPTPVPIVEQKDSPIEQIIAGIFEASDIEQFADYNIFSMGKLAITDPRFVYRNLDELREKIAETKSIEHMDIKIFHGRKDELEIRMQPRITKENVKKWLIPKLRSHISFELSDLSSRAVFDDEIICKGEFIKSRLSSYAKFKTTFSIKFIPINLVEETAST